VFWHYSLRTPCASPDRAQTTCSLCWSSGKQPAAAGQAAGRRPSRAAPVGCPAIRKPSSALQAWRLRSRPLPLHSSNSSSSTSLRSSTAAGTVSPHRCRRRCHSSTWTMRSSLHRRHSTHRLNNTCVSSNRLSWQHSSSSSTTCSFRRSNAISRSTSRPCTSSSMLRRAR